jgi:NAD(P)-dependent dehydrogenase (short-subunit alcohol dehydrogenase family)
VVITGSGSGLGAAYARHAASLGASVVVNDVDPAAAERTVGTIVASGGKAVSCPGDVSVWNFAETLVDACVKSFGRMTGFVNNAGILRPAKMEETTEVQLRRMFEVNLLGTAACAQAAARHLLAQGKGGSIINVASGSHAGDVALGGYAATKGAIASLTYSWAMELRDTKVRLNAISPLAETAMAGQNAHLMALQSAQRDVRYTSLPAPDVNAPLISFLLSDAANEIHGQLIRIADRQLSYFTHPMIASPVLTDEWTFEKLTDVFKNELGKKQQRLGLTYAETAP